jgi:hypothetical protein
VAAGEYLGIVGSSGNSGLPHLYFDLRDENWDTFDPYEGPCNEDTSASWWVDQRPYFDSAINAVRTHSAPPVFPPCPEQEIPNFRDEFAPADSVYFAIYHRDILSGQVTWFGVLRPDESIADSGSYSISDPHYAAAYALRSYQLPHVAPLGTWRIVVDYEGERYEHPFTVEAAAGVPEETALLAKGLRLAPNPFSSKTTILAANTRGPFRVQVFGSGGQLVRTLGEGACGEKSRRLVWDGRDGSGRKLPAGIYFIRIQGGERREGRVLLLR